jgi:hypothetical protein
MLFCCRYLFTKPEIVDAIFLELLIELTRRAPSPSSIFYPPFSILAFGTGSSVPNGTHGMQRKSREVVNQTPLGKPCVSIACSE